MKKIEVSELKSLPVKMQVLPINLQLFAEGEDDNFSGTREGVVDSQEDDDFFDDEAWEDSYDEGNLEDDEADEGKDDEDDPKSGEKDSLNDEDDADSDTSKSPYEKDSHFRKMRMEAEAQARKKIEAELAEQRAALAAEKQRIEQEKLEKKIMDEHLSQEKIWEKADSEGVSEEAAKKLLQMEAKQIIEAEREKVRQKIEFVESQKRALQNDRHFKILEADVDKVLRDRPDLDFQTVYYHMKGMRSEELDKQLLKNAEKRTVANMQDRARRRPLGGSDGGSDDTVNPSSILDRSSMEMSIAFGNDPRKVAKYVKSNLKKKG